MSVTPCRELDAAAVVGRGGPPAGARSDVLHAEPARLVLAAGRLRRPAVRRRVSGVR
ncbi:hypothetical protein AB0I06_21305 [Streptomyces sp. NPDC050674]|uniref:hypothetical protein n=1 Tax=Streptomyces sp. NPDC050674 TaxID=3157216 RepID=UPI0034289556